GRTVRMGGTGEEEGGPAQAGGSVGKGGPRVPGVVLEIAISPLPILPCLAPVNRRQAEQECPRRQRAEQTRPGVGVEEAASFQAMIAADIVVDAAVEAVTGRYDEVAFGRMQVAARRVTAHRPARAPELLPGRQPQRQLAQDRRTVDVEATRGDADGDMEVAVGGSHSISQERQIEDRCAVVGTEGVRLCRPVEVARSRGVAVKVML